MIVGINRYRYAGLKMRKMNKKKSPPAGNAGRGFLHAPKRCADG